MTAHLRFDGFAEPRGSGPGSHHREPVKPNAESAYVLSRLHEQRLLIRVACTLSFLLAGLRGAEQLLGEYWHPWQPAALIAVFLMSALLAAIVWTALFDRIYLPVANVVVPVRNAVAAAFLTGAAAAGQTEALMALPLMIIAPAFFLGLSWRSALLAGLVACLSFGAAAVVFALEPAVALRTAALLTATLAGSALAARYLDSLNRRLYAEGHRIADLAFQDALTGLKNRRVFDEQLAALWQQASDARRPLAILLIDVDHFKAFNDRFGHQAGDRELCRVAACLERLVQRPCDVLARYGGEEFAAILFDIDAELARELAEAMRREVSGESPVDHDSTPAHAVTISVGVACVEPTAERQPRGAVQLADQALYAAKQSGRNRVELRGSDAHGLLETGIFSRSSITRRA